MRNRISCSAQNLVQLEPDMVLSVVGEHVFNLGSQYFTEDRVTILEANSMQIMSEVSGTFDVYTQTIKLQSGTLQTKCSCPSNEQPFCRHCVAVLLLHHHDHAAETMEAANAANRESSGARGNGSGASSTADFNFRDVTIFIEWLQKSIPALEGSGKLPPAPSLASGEMKHWIVSIKKLHEKVHKRGGEGFSVQNDFAADEVHIKNLTRDLHQSRREAKSAQAACEKLQKEIERCHTSLAELRGVCEKQDHLIDQVDSMKVDYQKKVSELAAISSSLQTLSKSIQAVLSPAPGSNDSNESEEQKKDRSP